MTQIEALRTKFAKLSKPTKGEIAREYRNRISGDNQFNDRIFYNHFANPAKTTRQNWDIMVELIEREYEFVKSLTEQTA